MTSQSGQRPIFREVQYFRATWVWPFVLVCLVVGVVSLVTAAISDSMSTGDVVGLVVGIGVMAASAGLFWVARLETEVRGDAIHYRFIPFHLSTQRIPLNRLKSYRSTKYNPILEYGGWGIRYGFKGGKAYNVSGNRGVKLELDNGPGMMMGSRRPEEMAQAIREALGRI